MESDNHDINLNHTELSDPILEDVFISKMDSQVNWKIVFFVTFIPSVLSVIALIVAFVALSHRDCSNVSVTSASNTDPTSDRIWNIAVGDFRNNQEYIDEKSGRVMGFQPDLINAVCTLANKNCRLVFDLYTNCWDSDVGQAPHGGVGLFSGWYDACTGWISSAARRRTFKFSNPHGIRTRATLVVPAGNPGNVNGKDVTGRKIGFLDGMAHNEICFSKIAAIQGSDLGSEQIFHYTDIIQLLEALKSGEIDAGFVSNWAVIIKPLELKVLQNNIGQECHDSEGVAMMMRQDNPLDEWWNPALKRLMSSSKYREICQDVKVTHGDVPGLEPDQFCIDI